MQSQRPMVVASLLVPNHGVYPARVQDKLEESEGVRGKREGESWPSPVVMDDDHGEW